MLNTENTLENRDSIAKHIRRELGAFAPLSTASLFAKVYNQAFPQDTGNEWDFAVLCAQELAELVATKQVAMWDHEENEAPAWELTEAGQAENEND